MWSIKPRALRIWTWDKEITVKTDEQGTMGVGLPFVEGAKYALRVAATNEAARVWLNDALHTVPFHYEPGQPDGEGFQRTATTPNSTLDFSYAFTDSWTRQHFNLAETVRRARQYALAHRDPAEQDPLPRADVQPTTLTSSWFNAPLSTIVIHSNDVMDDS